MSTPTRRGAGGSGVGGGALGWISKHLPSVSSRSSSSNVPFRPNPFTQYTPPTTTANPTSSTKHHDKNINTNKNSTHSPPPVGTKENNGVEIPELIFVNPDKSSVVTTTSDPNEKKKYNAAASQGKRCTPRRILLFLAICVVIAIAIMAYMLTQYRFKKKEENRLEQQHNTNFDQPTPAPTLEDIDDGDDNNDNESTSNPTGAPVPAPSRRWRPHRRRNR